MSRPPAAVFLMALLVLSEAAATAAPAPEHEATKKLMQFVTDAAQVVASEGIEAACEQFRESGSRWYEGDTYVFVFDFEGQALCHPARPSLEGQTLLELRDPNGLPIVQSFLRELEGGAGEGWVHYLWPPPGEDTFYWKSSYLRETADLRGNRYIVGSGRYQMKMERLWIVEQVEDAVELIHREGRAAFDTFRDKASGFRFYGNYVFVVKGDGKTLVNVEFPELEGENVLERTDQAGRPFVRDMIETAKLLNRGWVDYQWPKPGDTVPSTKSSYVEAVDLDGETLVVGAGVYLD